MYNQYADTLNRLAMENGLRQLPGKPPEGCINLSSNDYLGLAGDKPLRDEFLNHVFAKGIGLGAASSRLLTGNCQEYVLLEETIAHAYKREACLTFNSGYHANIGILPSLAGKHDLIISDKLVHASIIDGMLLCKTTMMRYNHLDYGHLAKILQKHRKDYDRAFIVTESIFSMDGDIADIAKLVELKKTYDCFIYIDEAHAVGVRGPQGLGCAEEFDCISECDFIVGTFGKAIASIGAYLVCNKIVKQYLVNHSRPLIYTTALPPINVAWTRFIVERLPLFEEKRKRLQKNTRTFADLLGMAGTSHIVPWITGSNESAIALSSKLIENGIYALPIRYPTVPKGKARLRFSLNSDLAQHNLEKIKKTLKAS